MNRHAYLIMAHGSYEELCTLLRLIDDNRNDIFIHIDKNAVNPPYDTIKGAIKHSGLHFTKRVAVSWGGYSQIEAEMVLFETAVHQGTYQYYHFLSGQDIPVKSQDYIHDYCNAHDGMNFITAPKVRESRFDPGKTAMRYEQYHLLQDRFVGKKRNVAKYLDFASCYVQKALGVRRSKGRVFHLSYNWCSITDAFARFLVSRKEEIRKTYRFSYCCDEVFIISEFMESPFSNTLAPEGNLRFCEWKQYGNRDRSPRPIEMNDLPTLEKPDILFARKYVLPESKEVLEAIKQIW